jgi:cell division protein FtsL
VTQNVEHANSMISTLKFQYQQRIVQLQNKISEQNKEIDQLQEQIKLISQVKEYDC